MAGAVGHLLEIRRRRRALRVLHGLTMAPARVPRPVVRQAPRGPVLCDHWYPDPACLYCQQWRR